MNISRPVLAPSNFIPLAIEEDPRPHVREILEDAYPLAGREPWSTSAPGVEVGVPHADHDRQMRVAGSNGGEGPRHSLPSFLTLTWSLYAQRDASAVYSQIGARRGGTSPRYAQAYGSRVRYLTGTPLSLARRPRLPLTAIGPSRTPRVGTRILRMVACPPRPAGPDRQLPLAASITRRYVWSNRPPRRRHHPGLPSRTPLSANTSSPAPSSAFLMPPPSPRGLPPQHPVRTKSGMGPGLVDPPAAPLVSAAQP